MKPMEEKKLEVLHDHYKDTFAHLRSYIKLRDRLFFYLLVVVGIFLFEMAAPQTAGLAIGEVMEKKLGVTQPMDLSFMTSLLWCVVLGLTLRYYQNVVLIERQYRYIHSLERELSEHFPGAAFTREGKSYLNNYPWLSRWANALYRFVFPSLLVFIALAKWRKEWPTERALADRAFIFDTAACLALVATVILVIPPFCRRRRKSGGSRPGDMSAGSETVGPNPAAETIL